MKLARIGLAGAERPALIDADGLARDLSGHVADVDGATLAPERLAELAVIGLASLPQR